MPRNPRPETASFILREGTRPTGQAAGFHPFSSLCSLLLAVGLAGLAVSAGAQSGMQRLYSFGNPNESGYSPGGLLLGGNGSFFYGLTGAGGTANGGTVFRMNIDGSGYTNLHSFGVSPGDAINPIGRLLQGSDGFLYGVTASGGLSDLGTIFKVNTDGSGYAVLYSFVNNAGGGPQPNGGLVQGRDGALYGTTYGGGTSLRGTVFKLNTDGSGFSILHNFTSGASDGGNPYAGLIQGADGMLYGTAWQGGNGFGAVYKIGTNGLGFSLVYNFLGIDGNEPTSPVIQGPDGVLYGTTSSGGTNNTGVLFRVNTNGTGYAVLHTFSGSDGDYPAGLFQGTDGLLYGSATQGGTNHYGTLFAVNTNGSGFTVLHAFNGSDGYVCAAAMVQDTNGVLFGTTHLGGALDDGTVFTMNTNGAGYAILRSFNPTGGDGSEPMAGVIQAADSALYGTTRYGGAYNRGTIFRVNTNGTSEALLYSFSLDGTNDGQYPQAPLVQGQDGQLYGCAVGNYSSGDYGSIFKLNTNGSGFSALHLFTGNDSEGPVGIIQGSDGLLYGATQNGMAATNGGGALFRLNPDGSGFTIIHGYSGTNVDGDTPSPLIQGRDGLLYGTTYDGGTNDSGHAGSVFSVSTNGTGYRVLYQFGSFLKDGLNPSAALVQGLDGALYGSTQSGGSNNFGTIFRIAPDGTGYSILRHLKRTDGFDASRLFVVGSSFLYGCAAGGGTSNAGTIFALTTNGSIFVTLYNFPAFAGDGRIPAGNLVQGADGELYGTTGNGGDGGFGTVFRLSQGPIIGKQPADAAGFPFSTTNFSVLAASIVPISYQWLFNSNPLPGATNSILSVLVTPAQLGGYSVVLTNIYGSVTSTVATLSMLAATQALQSVVMLHNFGAAPGDGQWPMAGLMQATNGQLFGTTYGGGAYGNGTVFLLNTNGSGYATRAQFGAASGDAARPEAALIQGSDGALYGTAASGGAYGYGAVYQIASPNGAGAPVVIHSFGGSERGDGSEPYAALLQLSDGFLYGTTVLDGASGYGTLFRLSTDGATYSLRNSFSAGSGGGIHPYAGLVLGADGGLYGSTYSGGAYGYGTVFRLANPASGPAPQWLHFFSNSTSDGAWPYAGVAQSSDGTLYGTTWSGGASGAGTVFGVNAEGSGYAVRVNFSGTNGSGANPYGGVVVGNDGALYGTTYSGGAYGYGTLFRLRNPTGTAALEYLYSFSNTNGDGAYPVGGLLQAADGSFYGTTSSGGAAGEGTVYEFAFNPRIAAGPTNRVVAVGSTVNFSIAAAGTGPLTYQWLFNGNPVSGATNATLTLSNVTTNQTGIYAVVVFGAGGTVTSQPASLAVVGPPVFTSVARLGDGNLRLTLSVAPHASYSIQTSSNLVDWATQTNVFATSSLIQISDLTATNAVRRFYRAVWLP